MKPRVWFEREVIAASLPEIERRATVLGPAQPGDPRHELDRAEGAVVGVSRFDAAAMDSAPDLRVIARTGIGVDSIDVAAATARGIAVCNTPDGPTTATAEHTVALVMSASKRIRQAQARLQRGERDLYARHEGLELDGAVLGLVGFGRIGRAVGRIATSLGMRVTVHDPYLDDPPPDVEMVGSLDELLAGADVVSLHLPLTADTERTFDAERFERMRPGAVFVNAARGGLVDHDALLTALESGRLAAAGLDVTDPEPLPPGHPLLARDDVVVTPHIATATATTKRRMLEMAFAQVIDVLEGRRPPHLVDPAVWPPEPR